MPENSDERVKEASSELRLLLLAAAEPVNCACWDVTGPRLIPRELRVLLVE